MRAEDRQSTFSAICLLVLTGVLICVLLFTSCQLPSPPVGPPPPTANEWPYPPCPVDAGVNITNGDLCGKFTRSRYACVQCPDAMGCIDKASGVYCVVGSCKLDDECTAQPGGSSRPKR